MPSLRSALLAAAALGVLYLLVTPSVVMLPAAQDFGPAKPLAGPGLDGKPVSLADFRGRVVLVNVWATWCPFCRREIPRLNELYKELGPQGLVVLGAATDNDPASVAPYARAQGIAYPVLLIPGGADGWRGPGVPMGYLVERDGRVSRVYTGEKDMDFLRADLRRALKD